MSILAAVILLLIAVLLIQRKREAYTQAQITGLTEQLETLKTASSENLKDRESVLQAASTIYLYAALSEEEAQSRSLKEKQAAIRQSSEAIVRAMQA